MTEDTLALAEDIYDSTCADDEVFKQLVIDNHMMLLRVAKSIVGIEHAEEVVQEAWISIYKNLRNFEGRCSIKTWMNKITVNKAISLLRATEQKYHFMEEDTVENEIGSSQFSYNAESWHKPRKSWSEEDPQNILTCTELQNCIEKSILRLPEKQRLSFYLSHFNNESREEICKQINVSSSNVKVLIHRAKVKIFDRISSFQETGEY